MEGEGNATMKRWANRAVAAAGVWALGWTLGCGNFWVYPRSTNNGGSGSSGGDYAYVANATTGNLAGFAIGSGTLTAVSGSPYSLGFIPTAVAVNPENTMVFVAGASGGNGYINAYSIGSGGALTLLANNNLFLSDVVSMDVSPDGQWLMGLDASGAATGVATLDEFSISSNGQLTLASGAAESAVSGAGAVSPRAVKFAPNGDYVFAALGTAGDMVFSFNTSNGSLTYQGSLRLFSGSGTSDNALAVSSASTYLFVARSGTGGGLAVYSIGNNGALAQVGSTTAAGNQPFSVVVNKAGTDVYVANQLDSTISGYSVSSAGALTALSSSPYNSGKNVDVVAIDNSGNYLLATARNGSSDLTLYSYDSSVAGQLDVSSSTATGSDPTGAVALATTH